MNEYSGFERPASSGRGGSTLGRLPVYGHFRRAQTAIVRPFLFFISAVGTAAGLYFFVLAAPLYTSDLQIAVRGKQAVTTSPLFAALSGVQSGIPESTALQSYIESSGMLKKLEASQGLRAQYERFRTDFLYHLPGRASQRRFLRFYKGMVDVNLDSTANIITMHVRGFRPKETQDLAMAIMKGSQDFVGTLSDQMRAESTRASQQDVDEAQKGAIKAHAATAAFQARSSRLDPAAFGTATAGQSFQLQANIAQLRAQLASLATYSTAKSPQVAQVRAQIANLEGQRRELEQRLTGPRSGTAVVNQLGSFQALQLAQTYADQRLVAAQTALDQSRSVAQQRQLFIVPITEPSLPDEPTPRRWWGFATVLALSSCIYVIGRLVLASIRDHQI